MLSRIPLLVGFFAISIAASSLSAQAPQAPAYKELEPAKALTGTPNPDDPDRLSDSQKKAKQNRSRSLRVIRDLLGGRGAGMVGQEKQIFEFYFRNYLFPLMSQTDSEELAQWPQRRIDLLKNLRGARSKPVHDHLVANVIFPQMKEFVEQNYHPAVRYNAMLLIGSLNTIEPSTIDRQPPRPFAEALNLMLDELVNPQQIDAVKLAALIGILRHVDLNRQLAPGQNFITDDTKEKLVNAARGIVLQKEPPANRTPAGHVWMQRRALEVMASSGVSGDDRSFVSAVSTIADPEAPMSLRCTAASVLPRFLAVKPTMAKGVAEKLGSLTAHFCQKEMERVERQKELDALRKEVEDAGGIAGSTGFGGFGGEEGGDMEMEAPDMEMGMGMGMGMGMLGNAAAADDPNAYRVLVTRRRLLYQLMCTSGMLEAMRGWTIEDEAQKQFVNRVADLVANITAVAAGGTDDAPEGLEVADAAGNIDELIKQLKPAIAKLDAVTPAPKKDGQKAPPTFDPEDPAEAKDPAEAEAAPAAKDPAEAEAAPAADPAAAQPAPPVRKKPAPAE